MIHGPKGAVPTNRGWVSPKGELLKAQKLTDQQIAEWMGKDLLTEVPVTDPLMHTHNDGLTHSHEGGDQPHTHDYDDEPTVDEIEEEVQQNLFEGGKPKKKKKNKWGLI